MACLVHHHHHVLATAGLSSPRLHAAGAGGGMVSFGSSGAHAGHHNRLVVRGCRARHAMVTAATSTNALATAWSSKHLITRTYEHMYREDKFFEIEMKVRDEELDEYGVVNNAIYASYLTCGRDMCLEKAGISVDYWTSKGVAFALSELNLKYFAPLRKGDRFVVLTKPVLVKGVRVIIEHKIEVLPDRKLLCEGRGTIVCLNKDFRPTRVFPEISARCKELFSCKVD